MDTRSDTDFDAACQWLSNVPHEHPSLRPHQHQARAAIERAIIERKRRLFVVMATGTGKTITLVSLIHRLMKAGAVRRVLVLVDNCDLLLQCRHVFSAFEVEPSMPFDHIYPLGTSLDRRWYEWALDDSSPFVYISTLRQLSAGVHNRQISRPGGRAQGGPTDLLDIPRKAFDLVVVDDCRPVSAVRKDSLLSLALEHFDAIQVGVAAAHGSSVSALMRDLVFEYGYKQAVNDGLLLNFDTVGISVAGERRAKILRAGRPAGLKLPANNLARTDPLSVEQRFALTLGTERPAAPELTRTILQNIKNHTDEHERRYGRFPKTLIYAANDRHQDSHADQLVAIARDVFGRGESFVEKVTSRSPSRIGTLQDFRHSMLPAMVVAVDFLTGVDIPDMEFLVILRPVKSQVHFAQMVSSGMRRSMHLPDKEHFRVFDCFDEKLLAPADEVLPECVGDEFADHASQHGDAPCQRPAQPRLSLGAVNTTRSLECRWPP